MKYYYHFIFISFYIIMTQILKCVCIKYIKCVIHKIYKIHKIHEILKCVKCVLNLALKLHQLF